VRGLRGCPCRSRESLWLGGWRRSTAAGTPRRSARREQTWW
jgi:hypothetical protein